MYKISNNMSPVYLSELFQMYWEQRKQFTNENEF